MGIGNMDLFTGSIALLTGLIGVWLCIVALFITSAICGAGWQGDRSAIEDALKKASAKNQAIKPD